MIADRYGRSGAWHRAVAVAVLLILCAGCGETPPPPPTPPPAAPELAHSPAPPPAVTPPVAARKDQLIIVTYNVLADNVAFDRRTAALAKLIAASDADIVCLQEVVPAFLLALSKEPWFKERYHLPRQGQFAALINGNIVLCRTPIDKVLAVDHHSPQGRQSEIVWTTIHGRKLAIATCHLESMLEDGPIRARQLDEIFAALKDADDCILAGDFNFGDGETPDTEHLNAAYADLWRTLHPDDQGFTWNIQQSAMAAKGSFTGETSRRIDRILIRSQDQFWQPATVRIIGDEPLTPGDTTLFPSDHFGLCGSWVAASH